MDDEPTPGTPTFHDPRRRNFRARSSVEEVVALIDERIRMISAEDMPIGEAAGRVLAASVRAGEPVPPFDRAAMDGFALRGEETFGADPFTPALFRIIGRSRSGLWYQGTVGPGQAVEIATGAPLPAGADAVVPVEVGRTDADVLRVFEATPPARHVGRQGEDIAAGSKVLANGRVLRPQDLGVLSALGRPTIPVIRRPVVFDLITGDEVLPAGTPARGDQIADTNSVMVRALVARDGGLPRILGPLADDRAGPRGGAGRRCEGSGSRPRVGRKPHGTGGPRAGCDRCTGGARCPRRRPSSRQPHRPGFRP